MEHHPLGWISWACQTLALNLNSWSSEHAFLSRIRFLLHNENLDLFCHIGCSVFKTVPLFKNQNIMFSTAEHRLSLRSLFSNPRSSNWHKRFDGASPLSSFKTRTRGVREKLEGFSHFLANFWSQCLLHHAYLSENASHSPANNSPSYPPPP